MLELVIVSGKGGTGKTSLVGSLAVLAKKNVIVDCDVDAADLYLLTTPSLKETHDFIGSSLATIDNDTCSACGVCTSYCRFDAIHHAPIDGWERFWVDRLACEGCGVCAHFCPEQAINFSEIVTGQWFLSDTKYGPLVHAHLGVAQTNSGKLVSHLRQKAKDIALEKNYDLILIDGPPGIGCPVISTITGASYILIVTEPSLSAFHDLERLLELAEHFRVPAGLVINKYDINTDLTGKIETFAKERQIKIVGTIPFDVAVTQAQLQGISVVEFTGKGAGEHIRTLWNNLEHELQALPGRNKTQIQSLDTL